MLKVLCVSGSPRRDGNTDFCTHRVAENLTDQMDAEVTWLTLNDYEIKRCAGCRGCMTAKRCMIQDDDFNLVMDQVMEADVLVFGAPVYWYGPPGLMKDFIDRSHGYFAVPTKILSGKKAYLISVAADGGFEPHEEVMASWLGYYGAEIGKRVRIYGREKGDVQANAREVAKLEALAAHIVEESEATPSL